MVSGWNCSSEKLTATTAETRWRGVAAVVRHVLLEGFDALCEVAHQRTDLVAAEQQQDDA